MRERSRRGALLAFSALLVSLPFALVAYGSVIHGTGPLARGEDSQAAVGASGVRIGGHAAGLYPGSVQRLRIHVDNVSRRPLTVREIRAVVGSPAGRCSARNVRVSPFRGTLRLRPKRRRWVHLTISMRPDASNGCQRARFPLLYRAQVRR